MLPLFFIAYAASVAFAASGSTGPDESYGRSGKKGSRGQHDRGDRNDRRKKRQHKKKDGKGREGGESQGENEEEEQGDLDPLEVVRSKIDLEFDLDELGDDVASRMFFDDDDDDDEFDLEEEDDETFGVFPGPPTGAQVLQSAGLAQPGSWTQRNVLQAGARDSWSRRVAGNATEADFAVLRAARPGIASSASGYISPAWTKARWPGDGGSSSAGPSIEDAVADEMGF